MIVLRYQNIFYSRPLLSALLLYVIYIIKDKFHINNSKYIFFNYTFFQNVYFILYIEKIYNILI